MDIFTFTWMNQPLPIDALHVMLTGATSFLLYRFLRARKRYAHLIDVNSDISGRLNRLMFNQAGEKENKELNAVLGIAPATKSSTIVNVCPQCGVRNTITGYETITVLK